MSPGGAARPTPVQESIWLLDRLDPATSPYHLPLVLHLRGDLDPGALGRAFDAMVARHPVLSTVVTAAHGALTLAAGAVPALAVVDLSTGAGTARERYARLRDTLCRHPFDLDRGPLLRAVLVARGGPEWTLLMVAHHLVFDGVSKEIAVRELLAGYQRRAGPAGPEPGTAPPPGDLARPDGHPGPRDPAAAATAVRAALRRHHPAARAYWTRTWREPGELILPGRRRAAGGWAAAGAEHRFALGTSWCGWLDAAATTLRTTRFDLLLGGLHALLYRYGNRISTVAVDFGTRPAWAHQLIGSYVNELPTFAEPAAGDSFADLLGALRADLRELAAVRAVPLTEAVPATAGRRIAEVSVSYRRTGRLPRVPGLELAAGWARFTGTVRGALHLQLIDHGTGISASLQYDPKVVPPGTARQLAGQYRWLLRAALDRPHAPLGTLPLLPPGQRARIDRYAATAARYPDRSTLTTLLAARAARAGAAIAVRYPMPAPAPDGPDSVHTGLTYAELHRRADSWARRLHAAGAGPERVVAVAAERGPELVIGLLAVLKAGAAYLPLDPDHPTARLAFMLADAAPTVLVTQRALVDRFAGTGVPTLLLDGDEPSQPTAAAPDDPLRPPVPAGPDNAAYIIYTSGSTGPPKAVVTTHRAIVNRLYWMQRRYRLGPDDAVLHKTPTTFDVSVWELFWPLLAGAQLVLARPGGHRDPAYLRDVIIHQAVTTVHFVPSMLAAFLDTPGVQACTSLRRTICSGEELPAPLARRFRDRLGGDLHNLYGPTEAAIDVSAWRYRADPPAQDRVPIGRPIANLALRLLDEHLRPLPVGLPAELYLGGVGLARGYLNRPGLTATRFVADPDGPPGSRLYRTGDLARWRADGQLEYLGRLDHQIKIRGQRVELGEVEAALRGLPQVAEAAVALREDTPGDPRLVAYLTGVRPPDTGTVRRALRRTLPEPMLPAVVVALPALPVTANGKLDRAALPAPPGPDGPGAGGDDRAAGATAATPPGSPTERLVAAAWAEALGTGPVGPEENVIERGGHSLLAIRVAARLGAALGREVPLRLIFDHPTVRGLARALTDPALLPATARMPGPRARPDRRWRARGPARDELLPATHFQAEYWRREQLGVPTHAGISLVYQLRGPLDGPALEHALTALVARHEPLRSTFTERRGEVRQRVRPTAEIVLRRLDLTGSGDQPAPAVVDRAVLAEIGAPFDLASAPPLRALLIRTGADQHVLALTVHHIAADDAALRVLVAELSHGYRAARTGPTTALPPLPARYRDFVSWQRDRLRRDHPALLAHWSRQLAALPPPLPLPGMADRAGLRTYRRARLVRRLEPAAVHAVARLATAAGVTPFVALLTAYQISLGHLTDRTDIVVASLLGGRQRAEFEPLIGLCAGLTVLRTSLAGDPPLGTVLSRVRSVLLDAHQYRDLPFRRYARQLGLGDPADARLPIWDIWANATTSRRGPYGVLHDVTLDGLTVTGHPPVLARRYVKHAPAWEGDNLTLTVTGAGAETALVLDYNELSVPAELVERLATALVRVLILLVDQPDLALRAARRRLD